MQDRKETLPARQSAVQGLSAGRRAYNAGMRALIYVAAVIVVALLVFLLGLYPVPGAAEPHMGVPDLRGERGQDVQGIGPPF